MFRPTDSCFLNNKRETSRYNETLNKLQDINQLLEKQIEGLVQN